MVTKYLVPQHVGTETAATIKSDLSADLLVSEGVKNQIDAEHNTDGTHSTINTPNVVTPKITLPDGTITSAANIGGTAQTLAAAISLGASADLGALASDFSLTNGAEKLLYVNSVLGTDNAGILDFATLRTKQVLAGFVIRVDSMAVSGDGKGGNFKGVTGAVATYADDNLDVIVPTGGDGSAAWERVVEDRYFGVANGVATTDVNNDVVERLSYEGISNGVATTDVNNDVVERLSYEGISNGVATTDVNNEVVQLPVGAAVANSNALLQAGGAWVSPTKETAKFTPTFINGWLNFSSGGQNDATYRKTENGIVIMEGLAVNGTATSGTTLFTLPVGYRPLTRQWFVATTSGGYTGLVVFETGEIKIYSPTSGAPTTYTSLKCMFKAEQ